jgi:DNA-binding NarL/FixJ family response regulator
MPQADPDGRPLILLVEDEVLVRVRLTSVLESGGFRVAPVASADEALELLANVPDIRAVVTDVALSADSLNGLRLAQQIRDKWSIGVVVTSGQAVPDQADLPLGVYFLAKPLHGATLVQIVRLAAGRSLQPETRAAPAATAPWPELSRSEAGTGVKLTPRLWEVLELLMAGKSNRDIAQELNLSENTVKVHMAALFRALGVTSRTEAALAGLARPELRRS